jgi:hypothetical protein
MAISVLAPAEIDYPSSDGKPLAESDFQFTPIAYARGALREHFRDRPDVYVAADLLLYYEQGNREAVVAPDVFVVIGAPNHDRPSYLLWQEPKGPDFVLEVTSRSTRREDQGPKRERYRALGVQEYWQYDPTGDYLQPPLQGSRLVSGEYVPMPAGSTDGIRNMYSMVLGLELRVSGRELRFRDPAGGKDLLSLAESREARERAEREREQAVQEREQAVREREQAEREREQAVRERHQERLARQEMEARLAEIEAQLRRERGHGTRQTP